mmetsp:Transcript_88594/g.162346  ORF Transcript_88594/g.162346 Transcript_88594/m.162346 type:complete len:81 (-) Transcript_88594:312-554(-)
MDDFIGHASQLLSSDRMTYGDRGSHTALIHGLPAYGGEHHGLAPTGKEERHVCKIANTKFMTFLPFLHMFFIQIGFLQLG